jgi:cytochrome c peroxidase
MKISLYKSRMTMRLLAITMICTSISSGAAWGVAIPPDALVPLNQIAVPQPPNLSQYVKNKAAAIRLGKALFWDLQVGSDGMTACGSCHFSAGTDNRLKNTLHPGNDGTFQVRGANQTLIASDFPFHQRQAPEDFKGSPPLRDANDVVGSQGVTLQQFVGINAGSAVDNGFALVDPVFQENGVNLRQVTSRNTPSVINAVFNFTNFWDGRASTFFNGSSPFGPLDQSAGAWYEVSGTLSKLPVSMAFASLASQATGPPLNEVEMSFKGRSFPELGRKMLSLTPLAKQTVHPDDSELGNLSGAWLRSNGTLAGRKGLKTGYAKMIQDAFHPVLWSSSQTTPDGFSQMEANFSLFWGLAIQLYEATLISDDSPFDRFLAGDSTALTLEQQDGFNLFFGAARCDACHGATELTNASVNASRFLFNANNQDHGLLELMPVASGQQIIYDTGFNNTAVRPTAEDICRDGFAPFTNPLTGSPFPLSFASLAELQAQGLLPFSTPVLIPGVPANFPVANGGAFKVPGLRNVELTAPYMHNGSMMTLEEVVDFYARGGNFPTPNRNDLDINIVELPSLQGDAAAKAALVALMKSMTDARVMKGEAPFDRPEIFIANADANPFKRLPAKDINGTDAPTLPIVTLNPVTTPTGLTSQLIGGSKESGATITVKVNNDAAVAADSTSDTTWSTTVTGLSGGSNNITVSATDITGSVSTVSTSIFSSAAQLSGAVVINGGAAATSSPSASLTLSATGINPVTQMQFSKDGTNFYPYEPFATTRNVTLLPGEGVRTIYVRFRDSVGNLSQIFSDSILRDNTAPTGSVTINGGAPLTNSATAALALSAADANGVVQMQFSRDGVNYFAFESFASSRNVTLLPGDGAKSIFVRFKDSAGNVSPPVSAGITLDTTKPTGTIAFSTVNPTSSATGVLALSAADAGGVTQMQFSKDGINFFALEPFATARNVALATGINNLTVRYKDAAGNLSLPVSASITRN